MKALLLLNLLCVVVPSITLAAAVQIKPAHHVKFLVRAADLKARVENNKIIIAIPGRDLVAIPTDFKAVKVIVQDGIAMPEELRASAYWTLMHLTHEGIVVPEDEQLKIIEYLRINGYKTLLKELPTRIPLSSQVKSVVSMKSKL